MNETHTKRRTAQSTVQTRAWLALGWLVLVLLALSPVIGHGGWVSNDENLRPQALIAVYAEHFRHGDFFPMWASQDAYGYGTPILFYYHKDFFYVGGAWQLLTRDTYWAMLLAVATFMVIGLTGFYRLVRAHVGVLHGFLLSAMFLCSTYTFYDWLSRGAMAEFSFFMLLPWFMASVGVLIREGKLQGRLPLLWTLLFFAHNVMAVFALPAAVVALAVAVVKHRQVLLAQWCRIVGILAGYGSLFGLWLHIYLKFNQNYDVSQGIFSLKPEDFSVNPFVRSSDWYVMTYSQEFGFNSGVMVYVNYALWALLAVFLVAAVRSRQARIWKSLGLIGLGLFICALETPQARGLWAHFILGSYLQFPWRLQTFTVLFLLLALALLVSRTAIKPAVVTVILVAGLIGFLAESPLVRSPETIGTSSVVNGDVSRSVSPYLTADRITASTWASLNETALFGSGEYFPPTMYEGKRLVGDDVAGFYGADLWPSQPCSAHWLDGDVEGRTRRLGVECTSASVAALPVHYSWLTHLEVDGHEVEAAPGSTDGRARLLLAAGPHVIVVRQPRVQDVLVGLLP